jgi:predicted AlkP superfamily pyrophosphatase or phosphodiesterase
MNQHPQWVTVFNDEKRADAYFKKEWKPLLSEDAYAISLADNQNWYPKGGHLPKIIEGASNSTAPDPVFYGELLRSPFADALTLDFARAAIKGEFLGQDNAPDILTISLSSHDYINHQYSAESRLSHDHLLQLDRLLQDFFHDLDANIGQDNYIAVLTADHGFMPAPEVSQSKGLSAGRIDRIAVMKSINSGLNKLFGEGEWAKFSGESVLLNRELISKTGVDQNVLADETRKLLLAQHGFAYAYTRKEFNENLLRHAPFFQNMKRSWSPEVSGDIQFILSPYWMMGSTMSLVATHGSPYEYDKHVPILTYGKDRIKPMQVDSYVEVVDLAPTFAK